MVTDAIRGKAFTRVFEILLGGEERGFAVERVKDRLHQQQVHAAVHEAADLLVVGVPQLIEGHSASRRAGNILRCRGRAAGGPEGSRHPALTRGILGHELVGSSARHLSPGAVEVVNKPFQLVIRHRDRGGIKGVGLNDVRARVEVLPMDVLNDGRLRDIQHIVTLAQIPRMVCEFLAAVVGFLQLMGLNHCAHGAVDDYNAALQRFDERVVTGTSFVHSEEGFLLNFCPR